ncbi:hypothetical protein ACQKII_11595 [Lysinibacillus sp. NPDC048646]|uniref:hypothetical protein n=1 Tax=Lysinibacillus sp. NPDC048646 TaxID=3390574 RepID=UPI003D0042F1
MEKILVNEFASELIGQSKGRISKIDAEAIAINYISKVKNFNLLKTNDVKRVVQGIIGDKQIIDLIKGEVHIIFHLN